MTNVIKLNITLSVAAQIDYATLEKQSAPRKVSVQTPNFKLASILQITLMTNSGAVGLSV